MSGSMTSPVSLVMPALLAMPSPSRALTRLVASLTISSASLEELGVRSRGKLDLEGHHAAEGELAGADRVAAHGLLGGFEAVGSLGRGAGEQAVELRSEHGLVFRGAHIEVELRLRGC